ncbi:unnamed protein product [Ceratitis capitata]|uniref:(Mediterranean fruit fly) hypothetical protein n=1 Tax=Ceratitis capitata TaxID=7213 RepID=A0A811UMM0_CERCA|nr:unnamed protein product [Ceratitis capitata]
MAHAIKQIKNHAAYTQTKLASNFPQAAAGRPTIDDYTCKETQRVFVIAVGLPGDTQVYNKFNLAIILRPLMNMQQRPSSVNKFCKIFTNFMLGIKVPQTTAGGVWHSVLGVELVV